MVPLKVRLIANILQNKRELSMRSYFEEELSPIIGWGEREIWIKLVLENKQLCRLLRTAREIGKDLHQSTSLVKSRSEEGKGLLGRNVPPVVMGRDLYSCTRQLPKRIKRVVE